MFYVNVDKPGGEKAVFYIIKALDFEIFFLNVIIKTEIQRFDNSNMYSVDGYLKSYAL